MPLVIVASIPFLVFVSAYIYFSLYRTHVDWLRPLLKAMQKPGGAWWKRTLLKAAAYVASATLFIEHKVVQHLANRAEGSLHSLTRFYNGVAASLHYSYKELGELMPSWAHSFALFRHETFPREVNKKVVPVKVAAAHAGAVAGRVSARERANSRRLGRGIDRLKKETGLLAGILIGIDILVKRGHRARHHADHTRTLPRHTKELANHRARLKRIEKALGLGVVGALVYRVLARVAPWLFCRNVKKLGNIACGLPPSLIGEAFALFLTAEAIENLPTLVKIMQGVAHETAQGIKDLAEV